MTIFTVGHSTHDRETFLAMVRGIDTIIDVRSHPGSKHVPDYNKETMPGWLEPAGIGYEWWPELGGWDVRHAEDPALVERMAAVGVDLRAYGRGVFPKQRINCKRQPDGPGFTNLGFYDYSHFMTLPECLDGIERLLAVGTGRRIALMCCEAQWRNCHRSMIADYLTYLGVPVFHLQKPTQRNAIRGNYERHALGDRISRYDGIVVQSWHGHQSARNTECQDLHEMPADPVTGRIPTNQA